MLTHFLLWAKGSYQSSDFDTFECSGENLQNSSCHFPSNNSVFLQILHYSSMSWNITPLYFFSPKNTYFAQRSPLKWKSLRLLSAQVKNCQISYVSFETTSRFLHKFCIPLQFHERLLLCTFLAQTIYTLLKRSPLKWKFLRLLSAQVKFCQIPYANFETTSRFLFKFCIPLHFHDRLLLCWFLAQTIYTLLNSSPLKWQSLRLSNARVKIHQIPHVNFELTSQFLFKFCIILHCHDT